MYLLLSLFVLASFLISVKGDHIIIHMNLALALCLAQIAFLFLDIVRYPSVSLT